MAVLLGSLIGAMIDPLTWLVSLLVAYAARGRSFGFRFVVSIFIVAAFASAMIVTRHKLGSNDDVRVAIFTASAVLIWSLIADAAIRLKRHRSLKRSQ
jgi:hypothetical protein